MKIFQSTVCALFMTLVFVNLVHSDPVVENFLLKLFDQYPSYLANNSRDPTPPYPETYSQNWNGSTIQLNLNVSDYRFHNLSQRSFNIWQHEVNLTRGMVQAVFNISTEGFWVDGNYTAVGKYLQNDTWVPVSGQGRWKGTSPSPTFHMVIYYRSGVAVTGGYVNLRYADLYTEFIMNSPKFELEGLSAGGREEEFGGAIFSSLFATLNRERLPIHRQIHDYLLQSFLRTLISDM